MADARPTFPLSQRYTQRKQKQFSRPMTGHTPQKLPLFRRNLLHHRSARAEYPYTRSIIISPGWLFVKNFFRKNHKIFYVFSAISQILFGGDGLLLLCVQFIKLPTRGVFIYVFRNCFIVLMVANDMIVESSLPYGEIAVSLMYFL